MDFSNKHKPNSTIDEFKAPLMDKGFTQYEEVDHYKTFSPIVKAFIVRVVLALVESKNWHMH